MKFLSPVRLWFPDCVQPLARLEGLLCIVDCGACSLVQESMLQGGGLEGNSMTFVRHVAELRDSRKISFWDVRLSFVVNVTRTTSDGNLVQGIPN